MITEAEWRALITKASGQDPDRPLRRLTELLQEAGYVIVSRDKLAAARQSITELFWPDKEPS